MYSVSLSVSIFPHSHNVYYGLRYHERYKHTKAKNNTCIQRYIYPYGYIPVASPLPLILYRDPPKTQILISHLSTFSNSFSPFPVSLAVSLIFSLNPVCTRPIEVYSHTFSLSSSSTSRSVLYFSRK